MGNYADVFRQAWNELLNWRNNRLYAPENEEEVQCFLHYAMVAALRDARAIKPKPTTDKPERLRFHDGNLDLGDMHFPDFIVGENQEVVAELKFARHPKRAPNLNAECKKDIAKMLEHHPNSKRFFVMYDMCPDFVFLDKHQVDKLKELDPQCEVLLYPSNLNQSPAKLRARSAVEKMRNRGDDFHERGKQNAKKAIKGKR